MSFCASLGPSQSPTYSVSTHRLRDKRQAGSQAKTETLSLNPQLPKPKAISNPSALNAPFVRAPWSGGPCVCEELEEIESKACLHAFEFRGGGFGLRIWDRESVVILRTRFPKQWHALLWL